MSRRPCQLFISNVRLNNRTTTIGKTYHTTYKYNINLTTTMINCAFLNACVLIANTPFWVKKDPHRCSKVKYILLRKYNTI